MTLAALTQAAGAAHLAVMGVTDLQPGDFAEAEISGADDYDLWAG